MVERTPPAKGVEHQAPGDHTGLDRHLCGHQLIDELHQPQAPCKVHHDGQVIDLCHRDFLQRARPSRAKPFGPRISPTDKKQ